MLKITTYKKIRGFLKAILFEKEFYKNPVSYNVEKMFSHKNGTQPKKIVTCSAIKNAGYNVAMSYIHPITIKTNAPYEFLMKILEEWKQKETNPKFKGEINFKINDDVKKMINDYPPRFLPNPEKNWGPKAAAKIQLEKRNKETDKDKKKGKKRIKNK